MNESEKKMQPKYTVTFRFPEEVIKALNKIKKERKIKYTNDAVILAIKIVADNNFKQ